ncbi:MAG: DUF2264 domain-containing protein [Solirubrobacterales bacterium]
MSRADAYTRAQWLELADGVLASSLSHADPGAPWQIELPGPLSEHGSQVDAVESFARLLLLQAYRASARELASPTLAVMQDALERGALALAAGSRAAWPAVEARRQTEVEAASVASALALAPNELWDPLSSQAQQALLDWLRPALAPAPHSNNWVLFGGAVGAFFAGVGESRAEAGAAIDRAFAGAQRMYLGDGWYSDGPGTRVDYYNAWGFHHYLPLIAHLTGDERRIAECRQRLELFLPGLRALVDDAGAPVYFGRSQTYRFALLAPVWFGALLGAEAFAPAETRVFAGSVVDHFIRGGATVDGCLSVGWDGEEPGIAQSYSGAGSPLWAAKAFAGLLLEADDPVWSAPADPEPPATPAAVVLPVGVARAGDASVAQLANSGIEQQPRWWYPREQADPLYDRLAYSSVTRPGAVDGTPDNSIAVGPRGVGEWTAKRTLASGAPDWTVAEVEIHRSRRALAPPRPRLARIVRRLAALWAPRVRRGDLRCLSVGSGGIEVRIFKAPGAARGETVTATTWAVRAGSGGATGGEAELVGGGVFCQTAILHGFDSLHVLSGASDGYSPPAAAALAVCTGETGGENYWALATRISREPFGGPLKEEVSLVQSAGHGLILGFGSAEKLLIDRELTNVSVAPPQTVNEQEFH